MSTLRVKLPFSLKDLDYPSLKRTESYWDEACSSLNEKIADPIASSVIYEDLEGHPILAYFGKREKDTQQSHIEWGNEYAGTTRSAFEKLPMSSIIRDGLYVSISRPPRVGI